MVSVVKSKNENPRDVKVRIICIMGHPQTSSQRGREGDLQKLMKGDENRHLILGRADVVYDLPKNLQKPTKFVTKEQAQCFC